MFEHIKRLTPDQLKRLQRILCFEQDVPRELSDPLTINRMEAFFKKTLKTKNWAEHRVEKRLFNRLARIFHIPSLFQHTDELKAQLIEVFASKFEQTLIPLIELAAVFANLAEREETTQEKKQAQRHFFLELLDLALLSATNQETLLAFLEKPITLPEWIKKNNNLLTNNTFFAQNALKIAYSMIRQTGTIALTEEHYFQRLKEACGLAEEYVIEVMQSLEEEERISIFSESMLFTIYKQGISSLKHYSYGAFFRLLLIGLVGIQGVILYFSFGQIILASIESVFITGTAIFISALFMVEIFRLLVYGAIGIRIREHAYFILILIFVHILEAKPADIKEPFLKNTIYT